MMTDEKYKALNELKEDCVINGLIREGIQSQLMSAKALGIDELPKNYRTIFAAGFLHGYYEGMRTDMLNKLNSND